MSEGERLAREAARRLLNEIEIDEGASSVDDAMDLCHLEQHVIPEQLELPFSAPKDVRGILDLSGMNVFMRDARPARLRWVGAHEVGHYAIKEHNEILRFCSTFDLSREARIQLEVEANAFAAEFLFQGARFTQECLSEPFSLVLLRSKCVEFGVSYE